MIESVNNERIKEYSKLLIRKYREQMGLYLVSTPHLVDEALKAGVVKEVFLLEGNENLYGTVTVVTEAVMRKLTDLKTIPEVVAVCNVTNNKEIKGNVLMLDAVQDPGNLGTILRSAVAFNIDTVVLGSGCVDLYNEKTLRAAEGMNFNLNIINSNLIEIIPILKSEGYKIFGTKVTDGKPVREVNRTSNFALVVGNEGNGVSEEVLNLCDEFLYIKMNKKCESLNVGVATSIILYEFFKV